MARYTHKVTGVRVEVRDGKVMDSAWEPEKKTPARKPATKPDADSKS